MLLPGDELLGSLVPNANFFLFRYQQAKVKPDRHAATQQQLDAIIERLLSTEGYQEMLEVLPEDTMTAEPETMISLLDQIRSAYGSMEGYAREIGLDDAVLAALRGRFLED